MLTESFHGSASSQCDLSLPGGSRGPLFKRFMRYPYGSIWLKGNVCIIDKQDDSYFNMIPLSN